VANAHTYYRNRGKDHINLCYSKCGLRILSGQLGLVRRFVRLDLSFYHIQIDLFLQQHRCENLKFRAPVTSTMQNTSRLYGSDEGFWLTDIMSFYWSSSVVEIFEESRSFGSRFCNRLQVKKAPTLVSPLDRTILSHWALHKGFTNVVAYLPEEGNRTG